MDLCMSCCQQQTFVQDEPMSVSIFPLVDKFMSNAHRQNVIKVLTSRKNTDKYMSMVDFLLYECIEEQRHNMKAYYDGRINTQLKDSIDEHLRKVYEARILCVLDACLIVYEEHMSYSWGGIVSCVNKTIEGE